MDLGAAANGQCPAFFNQKQKNTLCASLNHLLKIAVKTTRPDFARK
jgi:hypothetical protein